VEPENQPAALDPDDEEDEDFDADFDEDDVEEDEPDEESEAAAFDGSFVVDSLAADEPFFDDPSDAAARLSVR
jgi:hypothetical protein